MDIRGYYRKIKSAIEGFAESFVVVVSHETPDGGKAGVMTEVARELAAKLLVEGKARVATKQESEKYYSEQRTAHEKAKAEQASSQRAYTILADQSIEALRSVLKRKE